MKSQGTVVEENTSQNILVRTFDSQTLSLPFLEKQDANETAYISGGTTSHTEECVP